MKTFKWFLLFSCHHEWAGTSCRLTPGLQLFFWTLSPWLGCLGAAHLKSFPHISLNIWTVDTRKIYGQLSLEKKPCEAWPQELLASCRVRIVSSPSQKLSSCPEVSLSIRSSESYPFKETGKLQSRVHSMKWISIFPGPRNAVSVSNFHSWVTAPRGVGERPNRRRKVFSVLLQILDLFPGSINRKAAWLQPSRFNSQTPQLCR